VLPVVAAAEAAGLITADHVRVLRDAVSRLPGFVDTTTAEQFEADLVRVGVGVGPKELKDTAELRLFLLDQDGPEPDDTERARKRGATMGRQGRDGMTALTAHLDPETAAVWEILFAKFAAPGMCSPADEQPCTSGTPSQTQIDNDHRNLAQRQHDALLVIGRIALMTDLGQLNGLPVSLIIRTTLQDLESRAGIGISGGGTKIPITDVIRMAGHAHWHLAVFDRATGSALNHFRARRVASPAQRIMLIARDGGCTKPGCTVGPYGCQAHHAVSDWADGGNTNIDEMALACGPDNRLVHTDGGYTTSINPDGDVEWQPPPHLEHSQNRINYHHRPELLLTPPDDQPAPEPDREPQPDPLPEQELQQHPQQEPERDLEQHRQQCPEWTPAPDLTQHPEPDSQWDLDWDPQWDTNFDQSTLIAPSVEHLWDTQPSDSEPLDPRLPPGWILLDNPAPWRPIDNGDALSGKAVRGP
jgi:hypothetical protein